MKIFTRFLVVALSMVSADAMSAPLSGTSGNRLTSFNGSLGSANNNAWASSMNNRGSNSVGTVTAVADFGNCNSVIMRCASPRCSNGGCLSIDVARPIVAGCVAANDVCSKHGDELIDAIAAQLVASSTATAAAAENAAKADAAAAAANSANSAMAQQMGVLQEQMMAIATQNQELSNKLESVANAKQASASSGDVVSGGDGGGEEKPSDKNFELSSAEKEAAERKVSDDVLLRNQISGEILSKIQNTKQKLKTLKVAMEEAFDYAECDKNGNNCQEPKRVKAFKDKARKFFDPYNDVLGELYDALIMSQSVGIDISSIYMMLDGSCETWGVYLCSGGSKYSIRAYDINGTLYYKDANSSLTTNQGSAQIGKETIIHSFATYDSNTVCNANKGNCNCPTNGGLSVRSGTTKGGIECYQGGVIPPEDSPYCTLLRQIKTTAEASEAFLYSEVGDSGEIQRLGCASASLQASKLFRGMKRQAQIDIDILERILDQDAPETYGRSAYGSSKTSPNPDGIKYCSVSERAYQDLRRAANTKTLPERVCVADNVLARRLADEGTLAYSFYDNYNFNSGSGGSGHICTGLTDCNSTEWIGGRCKTDSNGRHYYECENATDYCDRSIKRCHSQVANQRNVCSNVDGKICRDSIMLANGITGFPVYDARTKTFTCAPG